MFYEHPPAPKYQFVWRVSKVISLLKNVTSLRDLSLKDLSKRLAMLLALSNGTRSSDLHALDLRFRQISDNGMLFRIPGLTKTRRSGQPKEAFFHCFEEDTNLCPVENLRIYEEKTLAMRDLHQVKPAPLFLSLRKPYNPVTSLQDG